MPKLNQNHIGKYLTIFCLVLVLQFFSSNCLRAQIKVNLSEKHINKINNQATASQKLTLYRKYYKKDSIKSIKKAERYWQAKTDSLSDAIAHREKVLAGKGKRIKDGINSRIYRTVYKPWAKRQAKAQLAWLDQEGIRTSSTAHKILLIYFEDHFLQATQNDSLLIVLKTQLPSLQMPKQLADKVTDYRLVNPGKTESIRQQIWGNLAGTEMIREGKGVQEKVSDYGSRATHYGKILHDSDSLKSFAGVAGERMAMGYLSKTEQYSQVGTLRKYHSEIDKLNETPGQYRAKAEQLQDSAYLKDQAKKKAEEMALKYLSDHPGIIKGVQEKVSLLMKKYSVVPNSNDLSTAIKRSSLKDKPFRERIYFAANFQFISLEPVNIDLSPMLGYRFNRKLLAGAGLNYRQSFGKAMPTLAPDVLGYKAFSSYDVMKSFFIYGEFDRNTSGIERNEASASLTWKNAAFLGLGRKIRVHPKIEMTMTVLYNVIYNYPDPIYPKRWNIRVGIQTSALAMFKPQPRFN